MASFWNRKSKSYLRYLEISSQDRRQTATVKAWRPMTGRMQCDRAARTGTCKWRAGYGLSRPFTERAGVFWIERKERAGHKPGSVVDNHSSGQYVTICLKRSTREQCGPHHTLSYSILLQVGFTLPQTVAGCAVRSYRTLSPLPIQ